MELENGARIVVHYIQADAQHIKYSEKEEGVLLFFLMEIWGPNLHKAHLELIE